MGTITVAGEGRVAARPDLAVTTLGVEVYATTLGEAMAEAAGSMERVWQALRGAGLQDADLRTARYSVQVERPYDQKTGRPSDSPGYRVVNLVEARMRDLNRVGAILDDAIAAGPTAWSALCLPSQTQAAWRVRPGLPPWRMREAARSSLLV